ncbi:hypothetical protein MCAMS1_02873 [biofilm metagenome]
MMNVSDNGFGERLLFAIQQKGINQTEFARQLGVSSGFTSEVIRGLKMPGGDYLSGIKNLLGVSIDWLLTGDGDMYGTNKLNGNLLRTIFTLVALAKLAISENDFKAKEIISEIQNNPTALSEGSGAFTYLNQLNKDFNDLDLAVVLYTTFYQTDNRNYDNRKLLEAAISYFTAKSPMEFHFENRQNSPY